MPFCYKFLKQRFLASRALIWSLVSIGATLFSIGYVLKVFTAHYPDDPNTASIFEISGITLVILGGVLTLFGIAACFHSCCVVLCHRPAHKPESKKNDSQRSYTNSEKSEKSAIISTLPVSSQMRQNDNHVHSDLIKQQQSPFLVNGGFYPVSRNTATSSPQLPQRSATSPKFFPAQDDSAVAQPWNNALHDGDRRRHQSQGNVRQAPNDWDDSERPRYGPVDKSPETGKDAHPYNDDLLQQHLRRKMTPATSEAAGDANQSSSFAPQSYPLNQSRKEQSQKIRAKPIFRLGAPEKREAGRGSVWKHADQLDSTNKSPLSQQRSSNSVRHRQYFHEEHFTFSDFEPDDAFLSNNEQQHLVLRNEAPSGMATSSGSPLLSGSSARAEMPRKPLPQPQQQISRHVYANNNSNILSSPKPSSVIIPSTSSSVNVPVNSSPLTTAYLQHHHHVQQQQQQHGFSVDIDTSSAPLTHQIMSGGSTSSGRGSGSRGGIDHQDIIIGATPMSTFVTCPMAQHGSGLPASSVQPSPAMVTVTMASPCLVRRVSPALQRRQSPSGRRSHEQTPEFSGPDQSSSLQSGPEAPMEMRDFIKTPNGRIKCSPIRSVPHRPASESVAFNAMFRSTVIRGQLPNQRQFSMGMEDEEDADNDNTSPDPEDAFPTPKKSPKRDRLLKTSEAITSGNVPSAATFSNVNERALMTSRKSSPGVVSSAFVSHLPAQDPYPTTQAFLCEQEEII